MNRRDFILGALALALPFIPKTEAKPSCEFAPGDRLLTHYGKATVQKIQWYKNHKGDTIPIYDIVLERYSPFPRKVLRISPFLAEQKMGRKGFWVSGFDGFPSYPGPFLPQITNRWPDSVIKIS